jgi:hypothetical protein
VGGGGAWKGYGAFRAAEALGAAIEDADEWALAAQIMLASIAEP